MAHIASKAKPSLNFAINYGLTSGSLHSKKISQLLQAAGYTPTTILQADIIIAHSAGCWLIPTDARPKLIIYVGMPLNQTRPHRAWRQAILNNFRKQTWHALTSLIKSMYYGLRQPIHNLTIIGMAKTAQPIAFPTAVTVFIANRHDPWPHAKQLQRYTAQHNWAFIDLPGAHEDIWKHPERYVHIINHYARLLV